MAARPRDDDRPEADFWALDPDLPGLLSLHMEPEAYRHYEPHFRRLGRLAGGRLDRLAAEADRNPPVLHVRDRDGRDVDRIAHHPAYREMEAIAYYDFGLHAMSHRGGVLGWPEAAPAVAKYALQYLFTQAEFGLMCPVSLCDTSAFLVRRHADAALRARLGDMISLDPARHLKGAQFMTEREAGSDVGRAALAARLEDGRWRLRGDKWFCSHADADVALVLARPEGAPAGTRGLGLFAMPRRLDDGSRNAYRIVRLKDKLGTRSMASGEIRLEGAEAWPVGDLERGFRQMMEQVNLSRLSHGVRAAAMMRRCLNEALAAARRREAFGGPVIERPLMRRQLAKLALPAEQALSMWLAAAAQMDAARAGDGAAAARLRLLTALTKFRACRDNPAVATGAMEALGGNGYIEDWPTARLVRDAQVGLLWEGTSNINALDAVGRAVGRDGADEPLREWLVRGLEPVPEGPRGRIRAALDRAVALARAVAGGMADDGAAERGCRRAASALYHAASAALMAREAALLGRPRRLALAELVLAARLAARDPLAPGAWRDEAAAEDAVLAAA